MNEKYFKYKLRDYQENIIFELDEYLKDEKLNIVAPPGSGKTILGLEIICRLNLKTIIFVPTIAIREQWINSFNNNFVSNLKLDEDVFVFTYQSLNSDIVTNLIARLKNDKIIFCFDEAHHLHSTWLKEINNLKTNLKIEFTLSFTATPPYDLNQIDYNKYLNLCGEIDNEVEVTSLIKEKALCPHQDYIYFNNLLNEENEAVNSYKNNVTLALDEIINNNLLDNTYNRIKDDILNKKEEIYKDVSKYYIIVSYLINLGYEIKRSILNKWLKDFKIKKININDLEEIYNYIVFILDDINIKNIFLKYDLIEKNKVNLLISDKLKNKINNSINKLSSIRQIIEFEINLRKDDASILILTDYIRSNDLKKLLNNESLNKLSVISIFKEIHSNNSSVAVLSGSLVIIEKKFINLFKNISYVEFQKYIIIETVTKEIINVVSELYNNKQIKILIGTRSLLGEGWDFKVTNTLILASFVESYISSNQLRGRALRYLDGKVSHIWHLLSVPFKINLLNDDFELKRRFTTFYGLNYQKNILSNNIYRFSYLPKTIDNDDIIKINKETMRYANKLDDIKIGWEAITNNNYIISKELSIPKNKISSSKIRIKQKASIIFTIFLIIMSFVSTFLDNNSKYNGLFDGMAVLVIIIFLIILFFLIRSYLYISKPLNYLKKILYGLKETLLEEKIIKDINVNVIKKVNKYETYYEISISSKYIRDKMLFYKSLKEMLYDVSNPRYVLIYYLLFIPIYNNSLNCPSIISKNKDLASTFARNLKRFANYKLIYTRSEKGVKILNKIKRIKWLRFI